MLLFLLTYLQCLVRSLVSRVLHGSTSIKLLGDALRLLDGPVSFPASIPSALCGSRGRLLTQILTSVTTSSAEYLLSRRPTPSSSLVMRTQVDEYVVHCPGVQSSFCISLRSCQENPCMGTRRARSSARGRGSARVEARRGFSLSGSLLSPATLFSSLSSSLFQHNRQT